MNRSRLALAALLLTSLPALCEAEELAVKVKFDDKKTAVELTAADATYTLTDELSVKVLRWFDGAQITIDGAVSDGKLVFRQIVEPKLDSSVVGIAYKAGGKPRIQVAGVTYSVTGPGLATVLHAIKTGTRSITFEAYALHNADGSPRALVVKRVQATTKIPLFDKGNAKPGSTIWVLGEAWWGARAEVLGPGGTRTTTWWRDLTFGEAAKKPKQKTSTGQGLIGGIKKESD